MLNHINVFPMQVLFKRLSWILKGQIILFLNLDLLDSKHNTNKIHHHRICQLISNTWLGEKKVQFIFKSANYFLHDNIQAAFLRLKKMFQKSFSMPLYSVLKILLLKMQTTIIE